MNPLRAVMLIASTALLAVLIGCQESAQLTPGDRLYRSKCGSCHRLIPPEEHTAEQWRLYTEKYGKKMTPEEKALVLEHLTGPR